MRDRLPTPGKENRVRITLDNGQVVEGVLSYADDATQEGSTYTKGNAFLALRTYCAGKESTFQKLMTGRLI